MTSRQHAPLRAIALTLLVLVISMNAAAEEPRTWFLNSLAKPRSLQPDDAFLAQYATSPLIHAAWGEREAIELLVLAPPAGLKNLRVACLEFSHPSGDIWEPGTLRADFVGFVETEKPYYGTLRVGEWADPFLPDPSVDLVGGRAQPIWIEVTVPLDAEAGRYMGAVRLEADGWSSELPLEVEVWAFDLPVTPSLASSFLLYPRYVYEYHDLEKGSPEGDAMVRRYQASMLEHRIMPTHVAMNLKSTRPDLRISNEGDLRRADFTAFDAQVEWAMDRGQTVFGLEGPRKVNAYSEAWYRAVGEHLTEKGWLDRFYTYLFDETYEGVAEATAMVHGAAPGLKNLITRLPSPGFPDVDWWCPRLGDAEMHAADLAIDSGSDKRGLSDLWVYTAGNAGSDVPALHLDLPGIEARISPLAVWRGGYGGFLFWCVNYWTVDPWVDPMVYPRQNGNGSLFYPGPDGPLPSLRLKMLRDGFDDVDYARLLRAAPGKLANRILSALPLRSPMDWQRDPGALLAWRLAAGYTLSGDEALAASWIHKFESRGEDHSGERAVLDEKKPGRGWHGGRDGHGARSRDGGRTYQFTLDAKKDKLWRLASPSDWRPYRELILEIELIEGDPVRLNLKLGSGVLRRKNWSWEIHCPPGVKRTVRIPLPHDRVDTGSLKEFSLFLWEPDAPRRFEITGAWLR
jgi:hypothetical protein